MSKRTPMREVAYQFLIDHLNTRDNLHFTCFYCGCNLSDTRLAIDHMTPISKGGSNKISNLTLCCKSCNSAKGDKSAYEFVGAGHPQFIPLMRREIKREIMRSIMKDKEFVLMLAKAHKMYRDGLITDADIATVSSNQNEGE